MVQPSLWTLVLLVLAAAPLGIYAETAKGTKTHLILPYFVTVTDYPPSPMRLLTRAANYTFEKSTGNNTALLTRETQLRNPQLAYKEEGYWTFEDQQSSYSKHWNIVSSHFQELDKNASHYPILFRSDTQWMLGQAFYPIVFDDKTIIRLVLRDNLYKLYPVDKTKPPGEEGCFINDHKKRRDNCVISHLERWFIGHETKLDNYWAPITTLTVSKDPDTTKGIYEFKLFDATGRMLVTRGKLSLDNGTPSLEIAGDGPEVVNLSALDNPYSQPFGDNILPPSLKEKLKKNMAVKFKGLTIEAASPIYDPESVDEPIALCYSRGLKNYRRPLEKRIECMWKGEDQSDFVPRFSRATNDFLDFHAIHFGSHKGSRYFHLAYSVMNKEYFYLRYFFCNATGEFKHNDSTASGKEYSLETAPSVGICVPMDVKTLPNDIFSFKGQDPDGKQCDKVITIYDNLFRFSEPNEPITGYKHYFSETKSFPNIQTKAAFAVGNKIYLFSYSNVLTIMTGTFEKDCLGINLKFEREELANEFIVANALQRAGDNITGPPYYSDYREYVPGANDTSPSWSATSLSPSQQDSPTQQSSSNVVVIVVAVIVIALIVAALIYYFCLRGSQEDEDPRRLRKSRRQSPSLESLHMKTARSALPSSKTDAVGSTTGASAAKSPIVPTKSTKSTKSKHSLGGKGNASKTPQASIIKSQAKSSAKSPALAKSPSAKSTPALASKSPKASKISSPHRSTTSGKRSPSVATASSRSHSASPRSRSASPKSKVSHSPSSAQKQSASKK